jgi:hypothetical protein
MIQPKQRNGKKLPMFISILIGIGIFVAAVTAFLWVGWSRPTKGPLHLGVTFSQIYASDNGLNWREVLTQALDDLKIRTFRIPTYWNIVQPSRDQYDWSSIDYQMDEIARRNGRVLLVVGLKQPRWPECWMPEWVKKLTPSEEHAARLIYIQAAMERYKNHPALAEWQVENEPSFVYGECPMPDSAFFAEEVKLAKRLDPNHPITTTDSGELSTWLSVGPLVDRLGVSVYRVVRLPWGAKWSYDWIPTYWYARRALLVRPFVKDIFVSEFQMETWLVKPLTETPLQDQFETMDLNQLQKNFQYADQMQFKEIYFWGVEWWWWLKTQKGDPRFWDAARVFFTQHPS